MAISVTCTSVRTANGKTYVRFGKTELEFSSLQQAKDTVKQYGNGEAREFLMMLALAKYLHVDPTGSNPNLLEGKTLTLDLDLPANLVRLT